MLRWRSTSRWSAGPSERFDHVLTGARELDRPDLEVRVLEAWGPDAPVTAIEELAPRLDEDGDRFALDMARRRLTGDIDDDHDLRERGLEVYRAAPYARTAAALGELGVVDPPTDAPVEQREPEPDDPVYRLPTSSRRSRDSADGSAGLAHRERHGTRPKIVLGAPEPLWFRGPPITIHPPVAGIAPRSARFSSVNRWRFSVRNDSQ